MTDFSTIQGQTVEIETQEELVFLSTEKFFRISFVKCQAKAHMIGQLLINQILTLIKNIILLPMMKTTGLYLLPIESYSKNSGVSYILAPIIGKKFTIKID